MLHVSRCQPRLLGRIRLRRVGRLQVNDDAVVVEEYKVTDLEEWHKIITADALLSWLQNDPGDGGRDSDSGDGPTIKVLWLDDDCFLSQQELFGDRKQLRNNLHLVSDDEQCGNGDHQHHQARDVERVIETNFAIHGGNFVFDGSAYVLGRQPFQQLCSSSPLVQKCFQISFAYARFSDAQCRTLARFRGSLDLCSCQFPEGGLPFAEGLERNQGPWKLEVHFCNPFSTVEAFEGFVGALRMNTQLQELDVYFVRFGSAKRWDDLFEAIRRNEGLRALGFCSRVMAARHWKLLCHSVRAHPTIEKLNLSSCQFPPGEHLSRLVALVSAISTNTVITQVDISEESREVPEMKHVVQQLDQILECNKYHPHVKAVLGLPDSAQRTKMLGRAMSLFSDKPWLLYPFLRDSVSTWEK